MEKSVDGVLGIQTHGRRMVDADETTELWLLTILSTYLVICMDEISQYELRDNSLRLPIGKESHWLK